MKDQTLYKIRFLPLNENGGFNKVKELKGKATYVECYSNQSGISEISIQNRSESGNKAKNETKRYFGRVLVYETTRTYEIVRNDSGSSEACVGRG